MKLLIFVFCLGCASSPVSLPLIPEIRQPEHQTLPPDPEAEQLPTDMKDERWIVAVEAGSCIGVDGKLIPGSTRPCPDRSGLMSAEARAFRDGLYRLRYKELRAIVIEDRKIWEVQRSYYEVEAKKMERQIQILQPGFLDKYGLTFGVVGGFVLGISLSSLFLFFAK